MNMFSSMLIAATLIGGSQNVQVDCSSIDLSNLSSQLKDNCMESQIIIGNACDVENILEELGINSEIFNDCFLPSTPDNETPDSETPDIEAPNIEAPDIEIPDIEVPDIDVPDIDVPDIEVPDMEIPDAEIPSTKPDNGTNDTLPDNGITDTPPQESSKSYAEQVVALVNAERAKVNLPALTMTEELNHAAQIRAVETTQSFSHTRPDGRHFSSVLAENGIPYRRAGENIAWGQRTPEIVVNAWMNSEGHRANILNKDFTSIGIGYYMNGSTPYWVQLFTA